MENKWEYVIELEDSNVIDDFEKEHSVVIPNDLKDCIKINNGGMPTKMVIDTYTTKERIFGSLLSFNKNDKENIFSAFESLKMAKYLLIPFGVDPFGNFFCLKDNKIVLWLHETGEIEFVANTFTEMLDKLYD